MRCVAELERQQQQVQGSQESDSPYSLQKSGGSVEIEKSHDALGMNINEYADVRTNVPKN